MCPSLIEIGSKTAEKHSAQTNRQTDRHYENNGHLAVNQHKYLHRYKVVMLGCRLHKRYTSSYIFISSKQIKSETDCRFDETRNSTGDVVRTCEQQTYCQSPKSQIPLR